VSLFITGTDTGVGKTHIAARLLHLLRASGVRCAGMKAIVAEIVGMPRRFWQPAVTV